MQLIINITDHEKSVIDHYVDGHGYSYKDLTRTTVIESLAQAVHKGTPIPKGHGDLIDRNDLRALCYEVLVDTDNPNTADGLSSVDGLVKEDIDLAPTIIEADKAESEE